MSIIGRWRIIAMDDLDSEESRAERLLDKCTIRLRAGDVLRMLTPGGGGWGTPTDV